MFEPPTFQARSHDGPIHTSRTERFAPIPTMQPLSLHPRRSTHLAPQQLRIGAPTLRAALLLAVLAAPAVAQTTPQFLVSTSNDPGAIDPTLPALDDTDLMIVGGAALPAPWFGIGHWRAVADFAPRDVDAVAFLGDEPRAGDFYTSYQSDEGGFEDGDVVLMRADGTFAAVIDEESIALALGDAALDIDVDALCFEGGGPLGGGRMLFSLADNATSPTLGALLDGDVLELSHTGSVVRLFTEADVSAAFAAATGTTAAVGDVLGLDLVNGEVWASVQAPSSHDGAVIALGAFARVVAQESDLALGGEEIDAFALLRSAPMPCLWFETTAGTYSGRGGIRHGTPNGAQLVLASGASGWIETPLIGGFGGMALSGSDPLLLALVAGSNLPIAVVGANGALDKPIAFDAAAAGAGPGGTLGISVQVIDLATLRASPAFRITP